MKKSTKQKFLIVISLVLIVGILPMLDAYDRSALASSEVIDLASMGIGSSNYIIASGFAKVISTHTPIKATVKPFSGGTVFDRLINKGEISGSINNVPTVTRAYKGEGEYTYRHSDLRILFFTHDLLAMNLVVPRTSPIRRIGELKGKKVTCDFGGQKNIEFQLTLSLASAGLTWNDVVKVPVPDMITGLRALREGRADAGFGLAPTVPITVETDKAMPLYILPLEPGPRLDEALKKYAPGAKLATIKAGMGMAREDVLSHTVAFYFETSTHLSEATVYQIMVAVSQNYKELQPFHPQVRNFGPDVMLVEPTVPYHRGAIRFYKEKGLWTKEIEEANEAVLKQ